MGHGFVSRHNSRSEVETAKWYVGGFGSVHVPAGLLELAATSLVSLEQRQIGYLFGQHERPGPMAARGVI